jgi:hypothetical protein
MIFGTIALALAAAQPAQAPPCTARHAIATDVVAIASAPKRFLGRCVTVTGPLTDIAIFSGREGLYLTGRSGPGRNPTGANLRHRIGIDNQEISNLRMSRLMAATVTGRVDTCEHRREGAPFAMLTGYCHYAAGPTIVVETYEIGDRGYERMTGEDARLRYGNIAFMPADWPHRARLERLAAQFLAALRAGDRAVLAALHDIGPESTTESRAQLAALLDDPASPFVQLRGGAPSQSAIFVVSRDGEATPADRLSGILCFCRAGDCTDRWPIAFHDADGDPDRPYACTHIQPWESAGFWTPTRGGGLAEPPATAFRAAPHGSTR